MRGRCSIRRNALAVALTFAGLPAGAGEAPRISIASDALPATARWPEAERRARSELEAAGYAIAGSLSGGSPTAATLQIEHAGADAVIRVLLPDPGAPPFVRRLDAADLSGDDPAALVGLRVVELVDAALDTARSRRTPTGTVAPLPPPLYFLGAGGLMLASPGGLSPALGAAVRGARRLQSWLWLDADAGVTWSGAAIANHVGAADLKAFLFRLGAGWRKEGQSRLQPSVSLAAGALVARATVGGKTSTTLVALPSVRAGLAVALGGSLRAEASSGLGISFPQIQLRADDAPLASAGRPLADLQVGLAWALP